MNRVKKILAWVAFGILVGAAVVWRIVRGRATSGADQLRDSADGIAHSADGATASSERASEHIERAGEHYDAASDAAGRADTMLDSAIVRLRNYLRDKAT